MEFEIEHTLDAAVVAVANALLDEDFQRSLKDLPALADRTLLVQEPADDGSVIRHVRCVLGINIPGAARSFIGSGEPAWIEKARWDPRELQWEWTIEPEVAEGLLEASGTTRLEGAGSTTTRIVSGRVKVRVPLYGARVEGWIADGLRRAYDEEAERLQEWLDGGRTAP